MYQVPEAELEPHVIIADGKRVEEPEAARRPTEKRQEPEAVTRGMSETDRRLYDHIMRYQE